MKLKAECQSCEYWKPEVDGMVGECRYHAPRPLAWVVAEEQEITKPVLIALWPTTQAKDRCADWVEMDIDEDDNG